MPTPWRKVLNEDISSNYPVTTMAGTPTSARNLFDIYIITEGLGRPCKNPAPTSGSMHIGKVNVNQVTTQMYPTALATRTGTRTPSLRMTWPEAVSNAIPRGWILKKVKAPLFHPHTTQSPRKWTTDDRKNAVHSLMNSRVVQFLILSLRTTNVPCAVRN